MCWGWEWKELLTIYDNEYNVVHCLMKPIMLRVEMI